MNAKEHVAITKEREKELSFVESTHTYRLLSNGKELISVTTILREILEGTSDFHEKLKNNPVFRENVRIARDTGSRVHRYIENFFSSGEHPDNFKRNDTNKINRRYVRLKDEQHYNNFLTAIGNNEGFDNAYDVSAYETKVFLESILVAGTIDLILVDKTTDRLVVMDVKTSSREQESHLAQTYLYSYVLQKSLNLDYLPDMLLVYTSLREKPEKATILKISEDSDDIKQLIEKINLYLDNRKKTL